MKLVFTISNIISGIVVKLFDHWLDDCDNRGS
ncbi:type I toxin-antitoxin system Fst family toxin [Lactobacillus sp. DCY120]|uniref:Type I toxin-antitoxin system Fst family toxin n=1 Tax=Bombilactobacillus apium TaxID=2675299 RepID=A0A850QXP4_9LACO|nr:type I toxin-antitoxin system Fst family toxin [Bombilactobacillus apium]